MLSASLESMPCTLLNFSRRCIYLAVLLGFVWALNGHAAERDFGDYRVYYSVFSSDFLQPEIAQHYAIRRATDQVMVNVAVHKKSSDSNNYKPIKAQIKGLASDLIHQHSIQFKMLEERDAIYYLGGFKAPGRQVYVFDIEIIPSDSKQVLDLRFNYEVFALDDSN